MKTQQLINKNNYRPKWTNRFLILGAGTIALIAITGSAAPKEKPKAVKKASFLFVQNAGGLTSSEGKIVLHDVEPTTVCFSDRPERLAGHMPTKNFVPMWNEGNNSFLKDPPNGNLSILQGNDVISVVVVLRNPQISGNDLTYDVSMLEGTLPDRAGACSLFIDVIGMPLTPMSYAGVARRTAWRRGYYGGGVYGPTVYGSSGSFQGLRGSANWNNGSGTATGWRGNTITWHRD